MKKWKERYKEKEEHAYTKKEKKKDNTRNKKRT